MQRMFVCWQSIGYLSSLALICCFANFASAQFEVGQRQHPMPSVRISQRCAGATLTWRMTNDALCSLHQWSNGEVSGAWHAMHHLCVLARDGIGCKVCLQETARLPVFGKFLLCDYESIDAQIGTCIVPCPLTDASSVHFQSCARIYIGSMASLATTAVPLPCPIAFRLVTWRNNLKQNLYQHRERRMSIVEQWIDARDSMTSCFTCESSFHERPFASSQFEGLFWQADKNFLQIG